MSTFYNWTDERSKKLREMLAAGATDLEISRRLACSKSAIIGKRHRLGLAHNRSSDIIRRAWTQEELDQVRAMRASHSLIEISESLGRTVSSLQAMIHARKMPRKRRTSRKLARTTSVFADIKRMQEAAKRRAKLDRARECREAAESGPLVSLLELRDGQCRWPVGRVGEQGFGFCGAQQFVASSYCPHHEARAHS